ncbi:NADase-type glycan-binding domain-containing protein [Streptomyces iranensis]|uniref:Uncharacterized protein n=1 Tax=Streptomyces iranensis TaxID=576784 RepID=A0ABS4N1U7_9ACTN|nr:hypothetical protein [Streptomyces iranensis]MBP2065653.1 hypothetical protein [Streptomyces iranensis]
MRGSSQAPATAGPGTGEYPEADFDRPVRLRKPLITSGRAAKADEFLTQARPSELALTLVDSGGERTPKGVNLQDRAGQQSFDVGPARGGRVSGPPGRRCAGRCRGGAARERPRR